MGPSPSPHSTHTHTAQDFDVEKCSPSVLASLPPRPPLLAIRLYQHTCSRDSSRPRHLDQRQSMSKLILRSPSLSSAGRASILCVEGWLTAAAAPATAAARALRLAHSRALSRALPPSGALIPCRRLCVAPLASSLRAAMSSGEALRFHSWYLGVSLSKFPLSSPPYLDCQAFHIDIVPFLAVRGLALPACACRL